MKVRSDDGPEYKRTLIGLKKKRIDTIYVGYPHSKVRHPSIARMIDPSMIIRDEGYSHGTTTASILDLVPENCLEPEDSLRAVYKCPAIFYV